MEWVRLRCLVLMPDDAVVFGCVLLSIRPSLVLCGGGRCHGVLRVCMCVCMCVCVCVCVYVYVYV